MTDPPAAFAGIRPVLHMPFGPAVEQPIVHAELRGLVEAMLAAGVAGLVVLGLASEAWAMRESERDEVIRSVIDAIGGRVPLVVVWTAAHPWRSIAGDAQRMRARQD